MGGTRFFGIHMVNELLENGHDVTIATRGKTSDGFGDKVERMIVERTDGQNLKNALHGKHYDVVIDKIAYCSNDIKAIMEAVECGKYIHMSSTSVYEPAHINTMESDFHGTSKKLVWCNRKDFPYEEIKRQAECALWQEYSERNWLAVRYPFVLGKDDYTKRLLWYVEHIQSPAAALSLPAAPPRPSLKALPSAVLTAKVPKERDKTAGRQGKSSRDPKSGMGNAFIRASHTI